MELDFIIPAVFVGVSILASFFGIGHANRSIRREREKARAAAAELGLEYRDGEEVLKAGYEEAGQGAMYDRLKRAPSFIARLLSGLAPWRMEGSVEGTRVAVYRETRSSGKSSTTYTVLRAYYGEPLSYELRVAREGVFAKLGKALFGLADVEVGEPEFDASFRIKAGDPLQARLLLGGEEQKRALLEALERCPGFRAEGAFVHSERLGVRLDPVELRSVLSALCRAARALGGRPSR